MSSLPIGWGNRSNCMSEKDMKLGGIAATKFTDRGIKTAVSDSSNSGGVLNHATANAYSGAPPGAYQNSDQVREYRLWQIEQQEQQRQKQVDDAPPPQGERHTATPAFWEERQQRRGLEAEGFRNQAPATAAAQPGPPAPPSATGTDARVALVRVATHALEGVAGALGRDDGGAIPTADRAAFAAAVQRAMQALVPAKGN